MRPHPQAGFFCKVTTLFRLIFYLFYILFYILFKVVDLSVILFLLLVLVTALFRLAILSLCHICIAGGRDARKVDGWMEKQVGVFCILWQPLTRRCYCYEYWLLLLLVADCSILGGSGENVNCLS